MGRPRKSSLGLPPYVYLKGGAYRYQPPGAEGQTLGKNYAEALRAYADLIDEAPQAQSMNDVFDRFERSVVPEKGERQQQNYKFMIGRLRPVFGRMRPRSVKPSHVWQYFEERGKGTAAHHDVMALSHIFTWAKRWGFVDLNPCHRLQLPRKAPRRRYVTDAEFQQVYAVMPAQIQCAMDIALLTGLRETDILKLERRHLTPEGIVLTTSKTGVPLLIEWSPELRSVVDRALALRPQVRQAVIAKPTAKGGRRAGQPYTETGLSSIWQRHIKKVYKAGEPRWSFRDIRAKSASDEMNVSAAKARLGHTSEAMTRRYIRKPQPVAPLKRS
jgi:integrase